jgi:isopentenyl-diphosphate delta-isomerase
MGIGCALTAACTVRYQLEVGGGLAEHEYDHVFVGLFDGHPEPDPGEVREWCWMDRAVLKAALEQRPAEFTPWFSVLLGRLEPWLSTGLAGVTAW